MVQNKLLNPRVTGILSTKAIVLETNLVAYLSQELIISKPPSLLGDSQSLTTTGIIESLPICEPPKVQKDKETNDEYTREPKAYKMGM